MSDIFPKWTNRLPAQVLLGAVLAGAGTTFGFWYYFTPKYTRVGYQPVQPVPFAHSVHVEQVGIDCRYCHSAVEQSWYSNIPSASVCMNCHNQVLPNDPRLALVRESAATGKPIEWVQVHKLPDYVYFNHSVHVNRGVSCVECHGQINQMDEVYHAKPLSMSFCLECHRDPSAKVRPLNKITDLNWTLSSDPAEAARLQKIHGAELVKAWNIGNINAGSASLQNCSICHR